MERYSRKFTNPIVVVGRRADPPSIYKDNTEIEWLTVEDALVESKFPPEPYIVYYRFDLESSLIRVMTRFPAVKAAQKQVFSTELELDRKLEQMLQSRILGKQPRAKQRSGMAGKQEIYSLFRFVKDNILYGESENSAEAQRLDRIVMGHGYKSQEKVILKYVARLRTEHQARKRIAKEGIEFDLGTDLKQRIVHLDFEIAELSESRELLNNRLAELTGKKTRRRNLPTEE